MSIRIAIADDHPMIINGLQNILPHYPHIALEAVYANGKDLLLGLEQATPDVLLLDIQLPDKTGDELAPIILKKYPEVKILVLTNFDSTLFINNLFNHGVHGYILKTAEAPILVQAIEKVYNGEQFVEDSMKEKLEHLETKKAFLAKVRLTQREKEVLQLIVNGSTTPEIASKLFLSLRTAQNYRNNIMLKLDVNNTASLVKKTLRLGLAD